MLDIRTVQPHDLILLFLNAEWPLYHFALAFKGVTDGNRDFDSGRLRDQNRGLSAIFLFGPSRSEPNVVDRTGGSFQPGETEQGGWTALRRRLPVILSARSTSVLSTSLFRLEGTGSPDDGPVGRSPIQSASDEVEVSRAGRKGTPPIGQEIPGHVVEWDEEGDALPNPAGARRATREARRHTER